MVVNSGDLVNILVGGIPTPLKNMNVRWDYYSQYMEKNVPNHQPGIHYIMGLSENSVSHIPMDYHHVPH